MAKLVLFLFVSLVLHGLVASIGDKAKICRCDPYSRVKQAPWTISIDSIRNYSLTEAVASMNGLILNEKWVLATWEINCFPRKLVRPSVGLEVELGDRSNGTKNQLKSVHRMMLKDMGESKNESRYEFFLLELAIPIDFGDHGNSTFQPGCFLRERRKTPEFLYDNLR